MSEKSHVILIVEDEKPLQDAIVAKFGTCNCQTVGARSVEQAINYLNDLEKVDVIWLDHYLLGSEDGIDFVEKVKKNEKWKNIPIYVVSNTATQEKVGSYIKLGIEKYYVKADNKLGDIVGDILKNLGECDE